MYYPLARRWLKVFVIFRKRDELDTEVSIAVHGSSAYPLYSTSKHALGAILDLAILPLGKVLDFVLVFGCTLYESNIAKGNTLVGVISCWNRMSTCWMTEGF